MVEIPIYDVIIQNISNQSLKIFETCLSPGEKGQFPWNQLYKTTFRQWERTGVIKVVGKVKVSTIRPGQLAEERRRRKKRWIQLRK